VCDDCATDEEDEMDALERLLALKEIEDVITRYCFTFDDQDWDAFAKLWTEDAAFVAAGVAFEGRETMLDFLTTCLPDGYTSKHMCSRSLIEIDPDGTTARAKTDVVWIAANFENTIVARYDDTLVLQDGSWLFQRRVETPVEYEPGPPPMSETATSVSNASMRK
jgi:uncharacterized protein (TIGR02246 family)